MKPFRLLIHLFVVVSVALFATSASAQVIEWNHDPLSVIGPGFWGVLSPTFSLCGAPALGIPGGNTQTPVDIAAAVPATPAFLPLRFNYIDKPLFVDNNGHVIEVPYLGGGTLVIGNDVYNVRQFHFHAPSEHTLNGAFYDMEAHLVHADAAGNLAVVGVWMKACDPLVTPSCKPNAAVGTIFANAPIEEGTVPVAGAFINGTDILPLFGNAVLPGAAQAPPFINAYYTYFPGSLTTPPCTQGVRWFVLKDPVSVSQAAVDRFHEIIGEFPTYKPPVNVLVNGEERVWSDNNRPTQPLNGRVIQERFGR